MDPISAAGFASAILTFATVAYQITNGTLEIRGVGDNSDAAKVKSEFKDVWDRLINTTNTMGPEQQKLRSLAKKGLEIYTEIDAKLDTWTEINKKKGSLVSTLKLVIKGDHKKMQGLLNRANQYLQEVLMSISVSLLYVLLAVPPTSLTIC